MQNLHDPPSIKLIAWWREAISQISRLAAVRVRLALVFLRHQQTHRAPVSDACMGRTTTDRIARRLHPHLVLLRLFARIQVHPGFDSGHRCVYAAVPQNNVACHGTHAAGHGKHRPHQPLLQNRTRCRVRCLPHLRSAAHAPVAPTRNVLRGSMEQPADRTNGITQTPLARALHCPVVRIGCTAGWYSSLQCIPPQG